jgi:hypothetical protein
MTENTTTQDTTQSNNIPISVEQICAAVLATLGTVTLAISDLIKDYSNKTIAISQNNETKEIVLTLADLPETKSE